MISLHQHFQSFHKDINQTISKVTGKKEILKSLEEIIPNDALFDRLAAAPEIIKYEVFNILFYFRSLGLMNVRNQSLSDIQSLISNY